MRLFLRFAVGIFVVAQVVAQDPTIDRAETTNLRPGESAEVRVHGTSLKSLQAMWTTFGELKPAPQGEKPNDKLAVFTGSVPAETVPGIYPYRVVAANGCSSTHFFVVDDLPNSALVSASETPLPLTEVPTACCIQGYVNSIKPRYFGAKLEAGQKLSVEVYARRLNSAMDPVLKITSPGGTEIAFSDDQPGLSGDSQVQVTADTAGVYRIELHDVQYAGSGKHYFHLRIGSFPLVTGTYPRMTQSGANLDVIGQQTTTTMVRGIPPHQLFSVAANDADSQDSGFASAWSSNVAPLMEVEPNNDQETATVVPAEATAIAGRFDAANDVDWYKITADAKQHVCLTTHTRDVGSPADVVLQLWKADGSRIAEVDDTGSTDAQLAATLPEAGDYFVAVRELSGLAGADWTYDLEVQRSTGRADVTFATDHVVLPKDGTLAVPLTVKRSGVGGLLTVGAEGLPAGVTVFPLLLSGKQKSGILTLHADSSSGAWSEARFFVHSADNPDGPSFPVVYRSAPPDAKKPGAFRLPRISPGIFVSVGTAAAFSLSADQHAITMTPSSEHIITINAKRTGDWKEPITVAVTNPKDPLPAGVTLTAAKVEGDSGKLTIKTSDKANPGRYSLTLQGTLKRDKTTIIQPLGTLILEVKAADGS
ncbi:MAG: DVUA0089 family protein [Fuerstiella sp.]